MNGTQVLEWPYGNFEEMKLDTPYDAFKLAQCAPEFLPAASGGTRGSPNGPTEGRKLYVADEATLEGRSLRGHYISNTDRNKGHVAEAQFAAKARAAGFEVYKVPHWTHNYLGHVDFEIEWTGGPDGAAQTWLVDVKAPRALRRGRDLTDPMNCPQSQYACMELAPGGSLFGSKAHLVAYQIADPHGTFLIVDRAHSAAVIEQHLQKPETAAAGRAAWPEQSLWAPYVRSWEGVHTPLMYVPLEALKPLCRL
jgi:hypothetical protein